MPARPLSTLRDTADALARGATVLTATAEGAAQLRAGLQANGLAGEPAPRVLPWPAWTTHLWRRALLLGVADRMLLNRSQEEVLWRAEMAKDPAISTLHSSRALARLASDAWRLLAQHRGLSALPGSATNSDTETFVRLAAAFEQRCRSEFFLPEARLESSLRRLVLLGAVVPQEPAVLLVGFNRLTPAQTALLDALGERGVTVGSAASRPPARPAELRVAADAGEELLAAARAARRFLEEHPGARIALLVPGVKSDRLLAAQTERVLRRVLAPEADDIARAGVGLPFRIAGGAPLAECPAIAAALDLLEWGAGPLPLERVSRLLLSEHIAASGEERAGAAFDAFELRRGVFLRPEATLDHVLARLADSPRRERLPRMRNRLIAVRAAAREALGAPVQRTWTDWAEAMRSLLRAGGWGGEAPVDRGDEAVRRAWDSCLDELSTLDFDGRAVGLEQALETIRELAAETTVMQPSRGEPVEVMAPEDAAGLDFDAVWWLGAGDLTWPAVAGGNPLLSWPLRRALGLPGSDPAADLADARRLAQAVAGGAAFVSFSYAGRKDEELQRPSPVLAGLTAPEQPVTFEEGLDEPRVELEAAPDRLPVPPPPDRPVPGGAAVLKAQAACAFRAFAEYRLNATGLETRDPGLNARERGSAVHGVLERFWEKVVSQEALRRMSMAERDSLLGQCVDAALAPWKQQSPWDTAYVASQRRRLLSLGRRWLEIEDRRKVPFTVASRESHAAESAIGPLKFRLRLDRIDHTDEGAVLIDYKTGSVEAGGWLSERPDEPQLPLYAVLSGEPSLHAVAFASVGAGKKMSLTGYAEDAEASGQLIKLTTPPSGTLAEQVESWREVLAGLAKQFWESEAQADPKQYPATCKHCAHRVLCRLNPASVPGDEDEDPPHGKDGYEDDALG